MKYIYAVKGMHCRKCIEKITQALQAVSGVVEAEVSLHPPQAVISAKQHIPVDTFNAALVAVGPYTLQEKYPSAGTRMDTGNPEMERLKPLFVILAYLVGGVVLRMLLSGNASFHRLMINFMGGFFILFSLFKMLDLRGFAEGYATYDIVARRSRTYALVYPFIELSLGLLYLTEAALFTTNLITLGLMIVGSVGVFQTLRQKKTIQCACLGTVLKLPMTKVTLVEDLGMGLMAFLMLFIS